MFSPPTALTHAFSVDVTSIFCLICRGILPFVLCFVFQCFCIE